MLQEKLIACEKLIAILKPERKFFRSDQHRHLYCGRRGGLMVSALDSESNVPGSSPGRGAALCSRARHFTLRVPLSTQVYKWVPANLLLGASIPSRGE